ncbi:MAG: hypothetical protein ABSG06_05025 [Methanoregula sp.]|jgi:hypothetical protein
MINLRDVVRQVETALCDSRFPPTVQKREMYIRILLQVCTGAVNAKGRR